MNLIEEMDIDPNDPVIIDNPLLPDIPSPSISNEIIEHSNHMETVLQNERSGILGRTPSSELLSNLSSFNSSLSQSNEFDSSIFSIHKVVVLGMNPKCLTCPNCNCSIMTIVRASNIHWIMPFFIGLFVILLFLFTLLNLNLLFLICYCIGGVVIIIIIHFLNFFFSGKNRHYCPKCNTFIGFEKELVSV